MDWFPAFSPASKSIGIVKGCFSRIYGIRFLIGSMGFAVKKKFREGGILAQSAKTPPYPLRFTVIPKDPIDIQK